MEYEGKKLIPGQANNVFIFPGVGFGSVMIKAKTVTDDMFIAAARGLADYVSKERIEAGNIYPEINDLRSISATVSVIPHHTVSQHLAVCLCSRRWPVWQPGSEGQTSSLCGLICKTLWAYLHSAE